MEDIFKNRFNNWESPPPKGGFDRLLGKIPKPWYARPWFKACIGGTVLVSSLYIFWHFSQIEKEQGNLPQQMQQGTSFSSGDTIASKPEGALEIGEIYAKGKPAKGRPSSSSKNHSSSSHSGQKYAGHSNQKYAGHSSQKHGGVSQAGQKHADPLKAKEQAAKRRADALKAKEEAAAIAQAAMVAAQKQADSLQALASLALADSLRQNDDPGLDVASLCLDVPPPSLDSLHFLPPVPPAPPSKWKYYMELGAMIGYTHILPTPSFSAWSVFKGRPHWQLGNRPTFQLGGGAYRQLPKGWGIGLKAQAAVWQQLATTDIRYVTAWRPVQQAPGVIVLMPAAYEDKTERTKASWLRVGLELGVFKQVSLRGALYAGAGAGTASQLDAENNKIDWGLAYSATFGYRWRAPRFYLMPYLQKQYPYAKHTLGLYEMRTVSLGVQAGILW